MRLPKISSKVKPSSSSSVESLRPGVSLIYPRLLAFSLVNDPSQSQAGNVRSVSTRIRRHPEVLGPGNDFLRSSEVFCF